MFFISWYWALYKGHSSSSFSLITPSVQSMSLTSKVDCINIELHQSMFNLTTNLQEWQVWSCLWWFSVEILNYTHAPLPSPLWVTETSYVKLLCTWQCNWISGQVPDLVRKLYCAVRKSMSSIQFNMNKSFVFLKWGLQTPPLILNPFFVLTHMNCRGVTVWNFHSMMT